MKFVSTAHTMLSALWVAISFHTAQAQTVLCRCAAKSENLYRRPTLREPEERSSIFKRSANGNTDYIIDAEGYYILEGVRVLPGNDPACSPGNDRSISNHLFSRIFGDRYQKAEGDDYYNYGKEKVCRGRKKWPLFAEKAITKLSLLNLFISTHYILW